jgi:glycosyltransferase involved in cell wall biosynthesis
MRLLYVADGRSPIARSWISDVIESGHEVHLISPFPFEPFGDLESIHLVPVAFSGVASGSSRPGSAPGGAGLIGLRSWIRHWMGPWTLRRASNRVNALASEIRPDLVHAMRIPFEGMMTSRLRGSLPLVVSVWGNDFTLHAKASPGMRRATRHCLERAQGIHVDCRRDLRLAAAWGWDVARPSMVIPTNGGVRTEVFTPEAGRSLAAEAAVAAALMAVADRKLVVQPRGFRSYVRNDTFFRALPDILRKEPTAHFLCPAMLDEPLAERWIERLGLQQAVTLLPRLTPAEMAEVFRRSQVALSPTTHDGTPNTLLEAMACGCFPVAGDLESIREWIEDGKNGRLIDPGDPQSLALATLEALADPELRQRAAELNRHLVESRASRAEGMSQALALYGRLTGA